jgi:putative transposase
VKYRRKVFDDAMSERCREIFEYICPAYGIRLVEWNHDIDHIHAVVRAIPATDFPKFLNAWKSASSRLLKKEYPHVRKLLYGEAFWSPSYCLITAGGAPLEILKEYVRQQGED